MTITLSSEECDIILLHYVTPSHRTLTQAWTIGGATISSPYSIESNGDWLKWRSKKYTIFLRARCVYENFFKKTIMEIKAYKQTELARKE